MDRVIVGFDGSDTSAAALTWASAEARLYGAKLHVVTVIEIRKPVINTEDLHERLRPAIDRATAGLAAAHHIEHGGVAEHLVHACGSTDLLVVGSHGYGPIAERLLGSVSHACLSAARCAVVVVREEPVQTHGVVLVGVDGSAASRHALTVAADEARLRGAALHAIHTVHWDHLGAEWATPSLDDLVDWGEHLMRKELDETGVAAEPEVIHGHPADILTERSREADLLVVGATGHTALAKLLVGSTADHCARHAHCPTMIVHPR